jgi:hypothetical protein
MQTNGVPQPDPRTLGRGAAVFIGSSERKLPGGQAGGQLAFGLAKELCDRLGTWS